MLILATKLKNQFKDADIVQLQNIRVNDSKRGCSGFIQKGDKIVYVNTEAISRLGYMYRTADTLKDYTGGLNMWAKDMDSLVSGINKLLNR